MSVSIGPGKACLGGQRIITKAPIHGQRSTACVLIAAIIANHR